MSGIFVTIKQTTVVLAAWATFASPGLAEDQFAAIAARTTTPHLGSANHAPTLEEAKDAALRDCGFRDCIIAASVMNGCVAAAFSYADEFGRQWYGFADGLDQAATERSALQICEVDAHDFCNVGESLCTFP